MFFLPVNVSRVTTQTNGSLMNEEKNQHISIDIDCFSISRIHFSFHAGFFFSSSIHSRSYHFNGIIPPFCVCVFACECVIY